MDPADHNVFTLESRCRIVASVYKVSRDVMLAWFDSARAGDLRTMKQLYKNIVDNSSNSRHEEEQEDQHKQQQQQQQQQHPLIHVNGEGTSYGFVGSTALHWAAAHGNTEMMKALLAWGASPNAQNKGGSTPLHSACGHLRLDSVSLLLQSGANPDLTDCCNDTPADVLRNHMADGGGSSSSKKSVVRKISELLRVQSLAMKMLRNRGGGGGSSGCGWDSQSMKRLVVGCGIVKREDECPHDKSELVALCESALDNFKDQLVAASRTDAALERLRAEYEEKLIERTMKQQNAKKKKNQNSNNNNTHSDDREEDSDDDDDDDEQTLKICADKAKQTSDKGNDAFRKGDYRLAVQLYTAALSIMPTDATYYSNRSAAYLKMKVPAKALADAKSAASLRPDWAKPYHRWGHAALELGMLNDAVAAFKLGLERAPGDASLLSGMEAVMDVLIEKQGGGNTSTQHEAAQQYQSDGDDEVEEDDEKFEPADRMMKAEMMKFANNSAHHDDDDDDDDRGAASSFVPVHERHPWFTCVLCENRTRDAATSPCCKKLVCGTCAKRQFQKVCPFKCRGA